MPEPDKAPINVNLDLDAWSKVADTTICRFGPGLAGWIKDTLGEPIRNAIGVAVSDPLALYRITKLAERLDNTRSKLQGRGVLAIRPISPKLAIGLFEAASVEDSPEIHELWESLIANALDPNYTEPILPAYVDILRSLSALEAVLLRASVVAAAEYVDDEPAVRRSHYLRLKDILGPARLAAVSKADDQALIIAFHNLARVGLIKLEMELWNTPAPEYLKALGVSVTPMGFALGHAVMDRLTANQRES